MSLVFYSSRDDNLLAISDTDTCAESGCIGGATTKATGIGSLTASMKPDDSRRRHWCKSGNRPDEQGSLDPCFSPRDGGRCGHRGEGGEDIDEM